MFLPPGFRFHPTDVELVKYYLKRKVMGKKFRFEAISELNIYNFSPWELPVKSFLQSEDHEWYFFCPRERKYASGTRTSRTTENGFWKITCKDKPVLHNEQAVGMVKTLVFHKGHAPRVERTDWFMHEYWIDDKDLNDAGVIQDAYVLCRIFKKSSPGSKNGVQYEERFSEEDWYDEVEDAPSSAAFVLPNNQNISAVTSMLIPEKTSSISMPEAGPSNAVLFAEEVPQPPADDFDTDSLFASISEDSTLLSVENNNNLMPDDFNHDKNIGDVSCLYGNYINNNPLVLSDLAELSEVLELSGLAELNEVLELNDLEVPLVCPTEARGSESFLTDSLYSSSNRCDYEEQNCYPVNSIGPIQHVSSVNESPVPLEGYNWQGDYPDVFQNENDIRESANQGCNATSYNVDFIPCRKPEEGIKHAVQDRKRGKQQNRSYSRVQQLLGSIPTRPASATECHYPTTETESYKESTIFSLHGSSIHVNAEVSCWGGGCAGNALADKFVEFPYVWCCRGKLCGIDLGKKVVGCGSGLAFFLFLRDDFSLMWIFIVAAFTKLGRYTWNSSIPLHGSYVIWIVMQVLCSFILEMYKQGDILNDDELYTKLPVFQFQVNVLPYNMVDGCVL